MTVLTVPAGAVDAVSFLTMRKVFCALATGNVLFLSFALAGEGDVPVARPAIAIGAFMAGAAVAGVVLKWLAERGRPRFPVGLICEAVLLVCWRRRNTAPVPCPPRTTAGSSHSSR
jgi:uncharacterized membrane protein YoaK (UPF0700 family)